jgi:protein tyrosine phosphatase (PTP) superfamily phosphohydrolase (DUF442 family)
VNRAAFVATWTFLALALSLVGDVRPARGDPPIVDSSDVSLPENFLAASPRVYVGGEPAGEAAFAALAAQGFKTVVSVDGARPNVATAQKYGMTYVHIPIGYDGLPPHAGASLARLVRDAQPPIYIHCHHGKHRGPAAAAVACIAAGELDGPRAIELMKRAGTGENYRGLWRDVAAYKPPPPGAALPELVSVAEVDSLAAAMSKIDHSFDNLKLCAAAGWKTPPQHPDLSPQQESLLLREGLRETARHLTADHDDRFRKWLSEAEEDASQLERAIRQNDGGGAEGHLKRLETSCKRCHEQYRD